MVSICIHRISELCQPTCKDIPTLLAPWRVTMQLPRVHLEQCLKYLKYEWWRKINILFIFCWWWALVLLSGRARGELGRNLPCKKSQCNARKKQGKAEGILQQQSASEINASPAAKMKKLSVVPHHPVDVDTLKLPKYPVNITVLHPSQPVGMFKRNLSQRHTLVLTSKSCSVHLRQRCLHR